MPKRGRFSSRTLPCVGALQAKGLPLDLVTNRRRSSRAAARSLRSTNTFSVVIGGDDVQNKEPHPDPAVTGGSTDGMPATDAVCRRLTE
ncbi:HAD hydrolase-like protein [Shigella flexneri]